jgi:hypothetical protein
MLRLFQDAFDNGSYGTLPALDGPKSGKPAGTRGRCYGSWSREIETTCCCAAFRTWQYHKLYRINIYLTVRCLTMKRVVECYGTYPTTMLYNDAHTTRVFGVSALYDNAVAVESQ